ncbi:MAG: class I SAM-dependent methyltransferase [Deltaproteobacteria bacterium]|nr:class I SAM-dependent methyltransferase [Deltaproteobacteria bacterium]
MRLNRVEYTMMNNPLRASIQRRFEARRLLRMGGPLGGGAALEIGCGRGVGTQLIFEVFGANRVDAFDLDPRMAEQARRRVARYGDRARIWVGDATAIAAPDASYDAVFDFGIIHHIPRWRDALAEVRRVLKPGGRFYAEEILSDFIHNPVVRRLLDHPLEDRFDAATFSAALAEHGLTPLESSAFGGWVAWVVAAKAATAG